MVFRIDCALVFFNVNHVLKLLATAELERFEMVPQQGDQAGSTSDEGSKGHDGDGSKRGGKRGVHFSEHCDAADQRRGSSINGSEPSSPLDVRFSSADSAGVASNPAISIAQQPRPISLDAASSSSALLGGNSPNGSSPQQQQFDPDATSVDLELERPTVVHSAITNPAPGVQGLAAPQLSPRALRGRRTPDESLVDAIEDEGERREQGETVAASAASAAMASSAAPQAVVIVHTDAANSSSHVADDDFGVSAAASASSLSASSSASSFHSAPSDPAAPPRLRPCRMRALLLDFSLVTLIDTTAVRGLWQLAKDLAQRQHKVTVHFACVRPEIRGLIEEVSKHSNLMLNIDIAGGLEATTWLTGCELVVVVVLRLCVSSSPVPLRWSGLPARCWLAHASFRGRRSGGAHATGRCRPWGGRNQSARQPARRRCRCTQPLSSCVSCVAHGSRFAHRAAAPQLDGSRASRSWTR